MRLGRFLCAWIFLLSAAWVIFARISFSSCRHNTMFRFFTREECFYAASSSALWTTTIVSLFSTHLNKCNALYRDIYSCGNKPNEKDAMWMPSRQQMSHSARRACHLRRVVHVVERAAIKQSSRKLLSNSIALAWIQIFSSSMPRFYFAFSFASCSSVSIFPWFTVRKISATREKNLSSSGSVTFIKPPCWRSVWACLKCVSIAHHYLIIKSIARA